MLTKREKELLEAIKHEITVKEAALSIGLSPRTAYNMLFKIRRKYQRARKLVNTIIAYRKADGYLDRLLAIKEPLWKQIKEQEKIERELEQ